MPTCCNSPLSYLPACLSLHTPTYLQRYILRSDIMFERDPATAPALTDGQREAREQLREAQEKEAAGDIAGAVACYRRAERLDPQLRF